MKGREWPLWPTKPMLAQVRSEPFSDPGWLFEVKWDGVRCLIHLESGETRLQSRSLRDITGTYPEITDAAAAIDVESAVIDGEVVALDDSGKPSFRLLQGRMHLHPDGRIKSAMTRTPVKFYAFDLLYLDGRVLTRLPLSQRKSELARIMPDSSTIVYSDHVEEYGREFFSAAKEREIEGVMAKRKESRYEPGARSSSWLKIRIERRDEFVIGGWTPGKGGRERFLGALLLGQYDDGDLQYSGKVGTGFDSDELRRLRDSLHSLESGVRPFVEDPGERGARWAKPELVCEVRLSDRAPGALRFPVYVGLRPDKDPSEVKMPEEADTHETREAVESYGRVTLSNPDKVFWPKAGYAKIDLFNYYLGVADYILPHLERRPLTLHRQPDGIEDEGFYQRNLPDFSPDWIRSTTVEREGHESINTVLCQNKETLAWLANMGCIELHPWLARADDPEHPDLLAFDLDPVSPARYRDSCRVAVTLRDVMSDAGFRTFVKTSGKRGLHVYLPVIKRIDFDQVRSFVREVGRQISGELGDMFTMSRSAEEKRGRVFLDPSQNGWGRSLVSAYSLRPTPQATVSTPITWQECEECVDRGCFNIKSVPRRLKEVKDPWRGIYRERQDVGEILGISD